MKVAPREAQAHHGGTRAALEISIVMPCLNEAETIARCIQKAQRAAEKLGVSAEVIVADNGSTDGSAVIARELGARVVDVARKGYGAALIGGIEAGAMPWLHRWLGNPVLSRITRTFFHARVGDTHCGLRAFRKDAFERMQLRATGMEFASE